MSAPSATSPFKVRPTSSSTPSGGAKPSNERSGGSGRPPSSPLPAPTTAAAAHPTPPPSPRNPLGRQITVNPNWDFAKNVASLGIFTFMFLPMTWSITLIVLGATVKVLGDQYFQGDPREAYPFLNHPGLKRLTDIATLAAAILLIMPSSISLPIVVAGILTHRQLLNSQEERCAECRRKEDGEVAGNPTSIRNWKFIVYAAESISGYAAIHALYNAVLASFSTTALFYAVFYALLSQESYSFAKKVTAIKLSGEEIDQRNIDKQLFQALSRPILNMIGQCFALAQRKLADQANTPAGRAAAAHAVSGARSAAIELTARSDGLPTT